MRILIAEDDLVSRRVLEGSLVKWGYEVLACSDGLEAYQALQREQAPRLAILDWMMPKMDGVQVCRKLRQVPHPTSIYIILLTAKGRREDVLDGLQAGANDYITKPFHPEELQARVQVGVRITELERNLAGRVRELEAAVSRLKYLQGLLPICSYCKKVRDDQNYWQQIEGYISEHSEAQFSRSICPACLEKLEGGQL